MAIIFDGKAFARKREQELIKKVARLTKKPLMATILVGNNPASKLYVNLKQKAAERVGAEMDVYEYPEDITEEELIFKINKLSKDKTLSGIMLQLPLPENLKNKTEHILAHIPPSKDVDGLRENSPFIPATAKAVLTIFDEAKRKVQIDPDSYVVVVGAKGTVGRSLVSELTKLGYEVGAVDKETNNASLIKETTSAKILISATGMPNIITKKHIKKGAVVIDVGSPKGDVDFDEVKNIVSFITPVPGGVGPVTVISLLENLVETTS